MSPSAYWIELTRLGRCTKFPRRSAIVWAGRPALSDLAAEEARRRWRLMLGRYAQPAFSGDAHTASDVRLEQTLDYLYGREYAARGLHKRSRTSADGGMLRAIDWLTTARRLFPQATYERMQTQALERYGMTELLENSATLAGFEPNIALAKTLMALRGRMSAPMRDAVRDVIRRVVDELVQRLRTPFVNALTGKRNRFKRSTLRTAANFDWRGTIRTNLQRYDAANRQLIIERPLFVSRAKRTLPWDVILLVDQSGSMGNSVIYSAVIAGILSSLPSVRVRLLVFNTDVVELTRLAADPVEVLLTVQLGGGTDIGHCLTMCERLVAHPTRTVLAVISDFCECVPLGGLLASVTRLHEARVRLLGLAALDDGASPVYDRETARRLADRGMQIAALTPEHFAEWLAEVMA